MIFGVDYYPEHWDRSEWEAQADLMKEGGFNTVRMGEFAWKLVEREEGNFDFSLFDEVIDILAARGIKTIFSTPTAAPPKWLVNKYDVLQRDKYGRKKGWGARRECCANNPDYIKKSEIIAEETAKHYADNKNVIAWQIDNEFGCHASTHCYCEHCRKEFAKWLKEKYGTIENLNEKWGGAFWSLDYDSFDDVILPAYNSCEPPSGNLWSHNPALDLEYRRFSSDSWVKYQKRQIDILRKYTSAAITHNLMGHFSDINAFDLSRELDFVSWDNYPENQWGASEHEYVSMAHEIMRGAKNKNFVVMEEQAGPAGWDFVGRSPRPGELRLWTYQALAHGAEGIVYFRFRTALKGMEQYWYGVTDHDGVPRRRFFELQRTAKELHSIEKYIIGARTHYDALVVKSYDNAWGHAIKRHSRNYDYENHIYSFYKANNDLNVNTAVSRAADYEKYKVVYMPAYNIITDGEAKEAEEYVKNGGNLVLTFRSGGRDEYNAVRPLRLPGVFAETAGIEAVEFDAPPRSVPVCGEINGEARIWCDIIEPNGAKTLSYYDDEYYRGKAAITVNEYGKGRVYYVGCDLNDAAVKELVRIVSKSAGIDVKDAPDGVEIIRKTSPEGDYTVLLNYNERETETGIKGESLISGNKFNGKIAPLGAEIIRES